jgi:hypothetical protein
MCLRTLQGVSLSVNTGYTNIPYLHFAVFNSLDGYTQDTAYPIQIRPMGRHSSWRKGIPIE